MKQLQQTKAQDITDHLINDLAKLLRSKGYKYIEFGDTFLKCEGFGIEIKLTIK